MQVYAEDLRWLVSELEGVRDALEGIGESLIGACKDVGLLIPSISELSVDIQRARGFETFSPEALVLEEVEQGLASIRDDLELDDFQEEVQALELLIGTLMELPSASDTSSRAEVSAQEA